MASAPHHDHPDPAAPGSAGVPPASSSPDQPTPDPHQQAFNAPRQSAAAAADHDAQLTARLKNVEPLLDIVEQSEHMMRHMAREDVSYIPAAIIDHHDRVTTIAHRCAAIRKTLFQLHNATPHQPPPPGSAGVPPASSSANHLPVSRTGAPAGHDPSASPQSEASANPCPQSGALAKDCDPNSPIPSSIHNSSFITHNSPPPTSASVASASVPAVSSVRSIRSIPTIPPDRLLATAQKLHRDVMARTRNLQPTPPVSHDAAPNPEHAQSVRLTHTPDTLPQFTIENRTTPAPPDRNSQFSDLKSSPNPGTPPTLNHGDARTSQSAIDDIVATVTGVSRPKAGHTTVTDAPPTPQRTTNASHPIPHPHTTAPRTKVWKGGDGGLGEGEENFSKLSSPSPSSARPPP